MPSSSIWGNASTTGHRAADECQQGGIDNIPAIEAAASDINVQFESDMNRTAAAPWELGRNECPETQGLQWWAILGLNQ
jgi:hypothetical protein